MNHSLHKTLLAWFALAIVIMIGVATVVYYSFTKANALDARVVHTYNVIDTLNGISIAVGDLSAGSRG